MDKKIVIIQNLFFWLFLIAFIALGEIKNICSSCNCGSTLETGGKCYALLVGLNKYNFNAKGDGDLLYPEDEVARMAGFLCDQKFNVKTITGEDATVKTVWNEIRNISKHADSASRIFFYFSGHGRLTNDSAFAIVLRKFQDDVFNEHNYILADSIGIILAASPALQKVLIVDACYAGRANPPLIPAVQVPYYRFSRHAYLSITTWNDTTWDNFFTPRLLEGMASKADRYGDQNGYVDAGELCKYIDKRIMQKINRKTGENRRPIIALIGAAGDLELFKVNKKKWW
jgi:hypothetical protein